MKNNHVSLQYDYPKRQVNLFVLFLLMYEMSTYVANDMIMPGMLSVVRQFQASESFVSASLTAFILGGASLQLFLGPLSDRFGRRPIMVGGAVLFLLCTLFITFSFSMTSFMWARFFQGMGICFIAVIGYATLHELYDDVSAVRLISVMGIITILAPLAGPLLGVLILHFFSSWRLIFMIIACFAAVALIGLYFCMPETLNAYKKDGTYVSSTPLEVNIIKGNYFSLLKDKAFMFGAISLGVGMIPIVAWIGVSPLILIEKSHLSLFDHAFWQIPIFIACMLGNLATRWLTHFFTLSQLTDIGTAGMLFSTFIIIVLSLLFKQHYLGIVIGVTSYGFAGALAYAPLTRLTLFSTDVPKGTASALMSLILMATMALGTQIAGALYSSHENLYFSLFCALSGVIYILLYYLFRRNSPSSMPL